MGTNQNWLKDMNPSLSAMQALFLMILSRMNLISSSLPRALILRIEF